jgi:hypothetical protein
MQAFTADEAVPNYPTKYYGTFDTWQNILKSTLYVAVTLVSDAFIVRILNLPLSKYWPSLQLYRSFILWGRNYLIATFPFLLFIADIGLCPSAIPLLRLTHNIAIGVFWVYTLSLVVPGEDVFADALSIRVKIFYSITLAMNIICTCLFSALHSDSGWICISALIALKIFKMQKVVASFKNVNNDQVSRLLPIIVESGKNSSNTFSDMCSCTDRFCVLSFTRDYDWNIYF